MKTIISFLINFYLLLFQSNFEIEPVQAQFRFLDSSQQIKIDTTLYDFKDSIDFVSAEKSVDTTEPKFLPEYTPAFEKMPIPIKQVKPKFPKGVRPFKATVWVKCLIWKSGKVLKTKIAKTDARILNKAAMSAAKRWKFTPAIMDGKPKRVWVAIPLRFE